MHAAIERRAAGEPLQYVTGEMPFRHIVLKCERGVLIPRPETEVLVDAALEGVDAAARAATARRARTARRTGRRATPSACSRWAPGTGCIALSIASERPGTLVDSHRPLRARRRARHPATARRSASRRRSTSSGADLAAGVDPGLMGSFSVLVSNPPYIPTAVLRAEVPAEVPRLRARARARRRRRRPRRLPPPARPRPARPRPRAACSPSSSSRARSRTPPRSRAPGAAGPRSRSREDLTHRPRVLVAATGGVDMGARPRSSSQHAPGPGAPSPAPRSVLRDGGVARAPPTDSVYGICCAAIAGQPRPRAHLRHQAPRPRPDPPVVRGRGARDLSRLRASDVPAVGAAACGAATGRAPSPSWCVPRTPFPPEYAQPGDGRCHDRASRAGLRALTAPLVRAVGAPLAQTSANTHGAPSATTGHGVERSRSSPPPTSRWTAARRLLAWPPRSLTPRARAARPARRRRHRGRRPSRRAPPLASFPAGSRPPSPLSLAPPPLSPPPPASARKSGLTFWPRTVLSDSQLGKCPSLARKSKKLAGTFAHSRPGEADLRPGGAHAWRAARGRRGNVVP